MQDSQFGCYREEKILDPAGTRPQPTSHRFSVMSCMIALWLVTLTFQNGVNGGVCGSGCIDQHFS
jgi:hypothetical protein